MCSKRAIQPGIFQGPEVVHPGPERALGYFVMEHVQRHHMGVILDLLEEAVVCR